MPPRTAAAVRLYSCAGDCAIVPYLCPQPTPPTACGRLCLPAAVPAKLALPGSCQRRRWSTGRDEPKKGEDRPPTPSRRGSAAKFPHGKVSPRSHRNPHHGPQHSQQLHTATRPNPAQLPNARAQPNQTPTATGTQTNPQAPQPTRPTKPDFHTKQLHDEQNSYLRDRDEQNVYRPATRPDPSSKNARARGARVGQAPAHAGNAGRTLPTGSTRSTKCSTLGKKVIYPI